MQPKTLLVILLTVCIALFLYVFVIGGAGNQNGAEQQPATPATSSSNSRNNLKMIMLENPVTTKKPAVTKKPEKIPEKSVPKILKHRGHGAEANQVDIKDNTAPHREQQGGNQNTRREQIDFFKHVQAKTYTCQNERRFGKNGDGGYYGCMDEPFAPPRNNCLVYSFGINNEFSFDDSMHNELGCEVHSFDPSMDVADHMHSSGVRFHKLGLWGTDTVDKHGWNLMCFSTLVKFLGHEQRTIDYLKIDIETAEWPALEEFLRTNSIRNVRQMVLEIHTPHPSGSQMSSQDFAKIKQDLVELQSKLNFKLYRENHVNNCCHWYAPLVDKSIAKSSFHLCCFELFYVNNNLKQ